MNKKKESLRARLEKLESIYEAAIDFDSADEDAAFEAPHPIFMLAQRNDDLRAEVRRLEAVLDKLRKPIHRLVQWQKAYPVEVFPEMEKGDWARACTF